jgi:hypothetical protein
MCLGAIMRPDHPLARRILGSQTRQDYVLHVRCFAAFVGRSPDTAKPEDIRASNWISMRRA